ncbi:GNAT family N-acetyltransferase [Chloroflexota bacterium]
MEEEWICRDYQDNDLDQVLTLYRQVNSREMTSAHFLWKFKSGPSGKSIIKLMFDKELLIGFYSSTPFTVQVKNNPVKAALSVNTMTHPDYRGKGIFPYLGKQTYQTCRQKGIKFVYGFPNNNIYESRIKKLDWVGFGKMSILRKDLDGIKTLQEFPNIREIYEFSSEIDSLWEQNMHDYNIVVPRVKEFLNWRFVQHPTVEYYRYIYADENNAPAGYVVLKTYNDGTEDVGHIVDMLCMNDRDVIKSLIDFSCNFFFQRRINSISCWMPEHSLYARVLEEEGFSRQEIETFFGVKRLDMKDTLLTGIENFPGWHLTMADSDVY